MPTDFNDPARYRLASLQALASARPALWLNPRPQAIAPAGPVTPLSMQSAQARMQRFAPLLAALFPEYRASGGRIQSPLLAAPALQQALGLAREQGSLWIKADHSLPVAGSVKARGGFHEVLELAQGLWAEHGLLDEGDTAALALPAARAVLAGQRVAVGSTGNLGMAIGIMAAALGFEAVVHMSREAKDWKKNRLRSRGVQVVEHGGDYAQAVAAGRKAAANDPRTHFVDDERSLSLMLGYALAGQELQDQLQAAGIRVDQEHPLLVYLPCGVGGAPAGIGAGLKAALGPHVHCFFAEPTQAPCFLLRMLQADGEPMSIYQLGLSNHTLADGLAVPQASELAVQVMRPLLAGAYTVTDQDLLRLMALAAAHDLRLEPSAAAGLAGPMALTTSAQGQAWLEERALLPHMRQATHVAWTTGGLQLPQAEFEALLAQAAALT